AVKGGTTTTSTADMSPISSNKSLTNSAASACSMFIFQLAATIFFLMNKAMECWVMEFHAERAITERKREREHLARSFRHPAEMLSENQRSPQRNNAGRMPANATWKVALPGRAVRASH